MPVDSFNQNEMIIKMDDKGALVYQDLKILYYQTNLPKDAFSLRRDVFWKVRQVDYYAGTQTLVLEVLNYNESNATDMDIQHKRNDIERLQFKQLDWQQFNPLLSSYTKNRLLPILVNAQDPESSLKKDSAHSFNSAFLRKQSTEPVIIKDFIAEIKFEDALFGNGTVSFKVKIGNTEFSLEIRSPFIREEFDAVKKWFCKKFRKETFSIILNATIVGNRIINAEAVSEQIASIDQTFIEACKVYAIEDFIKTVHPSDTKKLQPITAILIPPGTDQSLFVNTTGPDIINIIIGTGEIRNKKQLEYLSSHGKISADKLLISSNPEIGFIFPFVSNDSICFIWELLDSHATYTWIFKKSASTEDNMYEQLEKQVSFIYKNGRENYIDNEVPKLSGHLKFERIFHRKPNEENNSGFNKWKDDINKIIV